MTAKNFPAQQMCSLLVNWSTGRFEYTFLNYYQCHKDCGAAWVASSAPARAPWPLRWWPSPAPSSFFKRWVTDISPSPCSLWSTNSYPPSAWRFKCNHCDYLFSIVTTLNNHITYRHLDFNILILTEVEDWLLHSDSSFVFCRRPLTFPFEKFDFPTT